MSGRWFRGGGRIAWLVALLLAWAVVLYATRAPQTSAPGGGARAASAPVPVPSAPASSAASVPEQH